MGNDGRRFRKAGARDDRVVLASPGRTGRSTSWGAAVASGAPDRTSRTRGRASGVSGEAGDDESSPVAVPSVSGRVGDSEASTGTSPRHVATVVGDGVSRASKWHAVAAVMTRARVVRVSVECAPERQRRWGHLARACTCAGAGLGKFPFRAKRSGEMFRSRNFKTGVPTFCYFRLRFAARENVRTNLRVPIGERTEHPPLRRVSTEALFFRQHAPARISTRRPRAPPRSP